MKKILYIALLLSFALPMQAQTNVRFNPRRSGTVFPLRRHVLENQNDRLQRTVDSLEIIIDSLNRATRLAEEMLVEEEPAPEKPSFLNGFNQAEHDSLMTEWFNNSKALDYDAIHDFDMDSVRFTSNVSDEEMMRRLSAMNAYITLPFNETVKNYMILYSEKMKSSMERVMGLSEYYFPIIEETLARYNLPLELKYMAIIESMLNPTATSRAGAKGMWQFMYNTAKGYGLHIDSFIDERLDAEKSIDAAARYLRDAYKAFGDWSLAISSYNCGAGNVSKAIRRAGKSDFWSIYDYLPRETRGYMPAFVGAMYAFTYYREYGITPRNAGMPPQTDTFEIRKKLHFAQISDVVGVPMEDIRNLNPQYMHEIIPGNEDDACILRLPYSWTGAFMEADQDSLYLHRRSELMSDEVLKAATAHKTQTSRTAYKVKSGDSLGKIAQRYHTSVANLKKWNNLRSDTIRIGQTLYINK